MNRLPADSLDRSEARFLTIAWRIAQRQPCILTADTGK
jgi:hypothetical protein